MFAVYASDPRADDPLGSLVVGERPDPIVEDGWVRVRMRAASLNMHDLWTLRGVGIDPARFPMILGCDGAGVLDDGSEVVIYPVIGDPEWRGDETLDPTRTLLTEVHQGTFSEYVVVPARNVVAKPREMSFPAAACMGAAWLSAYRMLFVRSGLRPGQTMLVQGATGGVSTALIALGKAAGFRVWVTGRTEEKRAVAAALGADATFPTGARLPERVNGVFETIGAATWSHSVKALVPGGVIVVSGATTGDPTAMELHRIFFLQLSVVGSTMGTRQELDQLLRFCVETGVSPLIGTEIPLASAAEGFQTMLDGEGVGKTIFTM